MKTQLAIPFIATLFFAALFYLGGYTLLVILGAIAVTGFGLTCFIVGAKWTKSTMLDGARLAIESASRNDGHDASKIKALADLTRETLRQKQSYMLPPGGAIEADFTIAGLDDEYHEN